MYRALIKQWFSYWCTGYGGLSIVIEGPHRSEIECKHYENRKYKIAYSPHEPGIYILNLRFADDHLPGIYQKWDPKCEKWNGIFPIVFLKAVLTRRQFVWQEAPSCCKWRVNLLDVSEKPFLKLWSRQNPSRRTRIVNSIYRFQVIVKLFTSNTRQTRFFFRFIHRYNR